MFHHRLLELEAELRAKEHVQNKLEKLTPECLGLFDFLQRDVETKLGDKVPKDWKGWISYKRNSQNSLIILRGRAFKEGMFGGFRAGMDTPLGLDSITENQRGFDVTPPQELDHLLVNFGLDGETIRVFLWYGENIAPYKLIYAADLEDDPHNDLAAAIVEACIWIVKRPKHQTLEAYLKQAQ